MVILMILMDRILSAVSHTSSFGLTYVSTSQFSLSFFTYQCISASRMSGRYGAGMLSYVTHDFTSCLRSLRWLYYNSCLLAWTLPLFRPPCTVTT